MSKTFITVEEFKVAYRPHFAQGAFSRVYKAIDNRSNETVIGKEILQSEDDECHAKFVTDIQRELEIIIRLQNHKNIVKYIAHYQIDRAFWIFMEFCNLRDLEYYLKTNMPLKTGSIINICHQAACGIAFMHQQEPPIIHRDIKLKNILMKTEGNETVLKICDFGLSRLYDEKTSASVVFMRPQSFQSLRGTPPFMAPEFSEERQGGLIYDFTVDVFSLGLVFLVVLEQNDPDYFPLSVEMKAKGEFISIGCDMIRNYKDGKPLPTVILTHEDDNPVIKSLKRIVRGMVQFRPRDRRPVNDVANELSEIASGIKNDANKDQERTIESLPKILDVRSLSSTQQGIVTPTALLNKDFVLCDEFNATPQMEDVIGLMDSREVTNKALIKQLRYLEPFCVCLSSTGNDIVVGGREVTLYNNEGEKREICFGSFMAVSCQSGKVFACKTSGSTIDVFDSNILTKIRTYQVPCPGDKDGHYRHTIAVSRDKIYIACRYASQTFIIDMAGQLLRTHKDISINGLKLKYPSVCKIPLGKAGAVIADVGNNRLCMLYHDEWCTLRLQPQPVRPIGAAFIENNLHVFCYNDDDTETHEKRYRIVKYIQAGQDIQVLQAEVKPVFRPGKETTKKCLIQ